jgi:hypothetical protein
MFLFLDPVKSPYKQKPLTKIRGLTTEKIHPAMPCEPFCWDLPGQVGIFYQEVLPG